MDMERVTLSALTPKSRKVKVCIRVMRKWSYHGVNPDGPPIYVGLIFADQQGTAMYAQIPGTEVATKSALFQVDGIYTVSKFNVRPAKPNYLPFDARLMIMITSFTEAMPSNAPAQSFPLYVYNITHFHEIRTTPEALSKYIDVIGVITHIAKPKTVSLSHKERIANLREVIIKDLRDRELTVTLWGENVTSFSLDEASATKPAISIVVLFVGCLPRRIYGKTQLNAGNACRWFFNPQIEEAKPFYTRLAAHPVEVIEEPIDDSSSATEIVPVMLQEKKLAELNVLDPYQFPDKGCKCTVTITEIPGHIKWWYMACEVCHKKATYESGRYYCAECNRHGATPRYKLTFIARDDTAEAAFFCHDDTARLLVRRGCDYLINPLHPDDGIPQGLAQIISKTFTFAVDLADDSFFTMHQRKYNVKAIVVHPDLQPSIQQSSVSEEHRYAMVTTSTNTSKKNENIPKNAAALVATTAATDTQEEIIENATDIHKTPPPQGTPNFKHRAHAEQSMMHEEPKASAQRPLFQSPQHDQSSTETTSLSDQQIDRPSKRAKISAAKQQKTKESEK